MHTSAVSLFMITILWVFFNDPYLSFNLNSVFLVSIGCLSNNVLFGWFIAASSVVVGLSLALSEMENQLDYKIKPQALYPLHKASEVPI